jgi:hypothetical protein
MITGLFSVANGMVQMKTPETTEEARRRAGMSEKENEKKKEEKNEEDKDKYKLMLVTIRVPKWLLEAFDKTVPPSGRAEAVRQWMRDRVATYGGKMPVNEEQLKLQLDKNRQEVAKLERNNKIWSVLNLVLRQEPAIFRPEERQKRVEESLKPEYIPQILKDLAKYKPRANDNFDRCDVLDTIYYLQAKQELAKNVQQIDSYLAIKLGVNESEHTEQKDNKEERPYVPLNQRNSECEFYETTEQFEARRQKEREEKEAEERERAEQERKWREEHPGYDEDNDDEEEEEDEDEW